MKFLDMDSPLMQGLGKMADLLWLNVLTLICCIPIVTIGASFTAMNYMALKMARNEECYITRGFFKSFRENFKQATLIWLLLLFVFIILAGDFFIIRNSGLEFNVIFQAVLMAVSFLMLCTFMFVFPVLAKFENTLMRTIKNAFLMSIMQFPKTILMIILYAIPPFVFIFFMQIAPIPLLFGLSVPAWLSAKLYNKFFRKLEDQINAAKEPSQDEETGEDERIFRDELDESLVGDTEG